MLLTIVKRVFAIFSERFDNSPIVSVAQMTRFVGTRAAYVAQTSLYGYLKTRMGTSFQRHFEDSTFSAVIKDSAVRLCVSCLADLTVFAVASARANAPDTFDDASAATLAQHAYGEALATTVDAEDLARLAPNALDAFAARAAETHWPNAAIGETAFAGSTADLIRIAPVVDEFKAQDGRIVTNSIRFRWRDVRDQWRKRVDGAALAADWNTRAKTNNPPVSETKPGG